MWIALIVVVAGALVAFKFAEFVLPFLATVDWLSRASGETSGQRWRRVLTDAGLASVAGAGAIGFCLVALLLVKDRRNLEWVTCLFFPAASIVAVPIWFLFKLRRRKTESPLESDSIKGDNPP